jgi:cyclic-di-GMP-binding protein
MASESSFDIVSQFDMQELRNAVDQVKREISTRYDFKGINAEVTLTDNDITLVCPDSMKLKAIQDMLLQKLVNRKLSPKILDMGTPEQAAGGNLRQLIKLVKALDQETCKTISKIIKERFPKAKSSIQGTAVRVSSKSKDDLQAVIANLRQQDLKAPLEFTNYR